MTGELVVLQHQSGAGPSAFREVLDARTSLAPWRLVDVAAGEPLPEVSGLAGVISMGGAMGVPDADEHPWMADEMALLRAAVEAEVPVLGVCLGAQLLAAALGGKVERRAVPEIGYLPLTRTEDAADDAVAAGWPDGTRALFVHEDEITTLPDDGRVVLAGSETPAAWRSGSGLAVQFHPEVTAEQLATWVEMPALQRLLGSAGVDPEELLDEARRRDRFVVAQGRALVGRWIDGPLRKHLAAQQA